MGLSILNLAKKAVDQVNPFDNGKTWQNPQGNAPAQQAAGKPAPSLIQQATHNGLTNTLGNFVGKPFVLNPAQITAETGRGLVADVTDNPAAERASAHRAWQDVQASIPGQIAKQGLQIAKTVGNTPYAIAGDVQSAITGKAPSPRFAAAQTAGARALNQTIPGQLVRPATAGVVALTHMSPADQAANGLNPNATGAQKYFADPASAIAAILGSKAVIEGGLKAPINNAVNTVRNANSISDVAPNLTAIPGKVASTATNLATAVKGHYTQPVDNLVDNPTVTPKAVVAMKQAGKDAGKTTPPPVVPVETPPPADPAAPAAPVETTAKPPTGQIAASPIKPADTGMPEVDKAINDVADQYSKPQSFSGQVSDVVKQAMGRSQTGLRVANTLRKTLTKNLTDKENQAVSDYLDGKATKDLTTKAFKVANALKPLHDQAFDVRKAIDPNVNKVNDYVSRIPSQSIRAAAVRTGSVLGKVRSLADIHNLKSSFSQERQVGKFISKDDTHYGTAKQAGLTKVDGNSFKDASGKIYRQVAVSKRELENNGAGEYEHHIGRIQGIYHSDTLSLKVRAEAVKQLAEHPNDHGLYTEADIRSGNAPKDVAKIAGVSKLVDKEGNPLYASVKDAKALQDRLGFTPKAKDSLPIRAYDAVSNVATQFIVLNPFFHGMNQLYQTGIAAGNLPGMGTGWLKVARGVIDANEDDVHSYLDNGGHLPDYGSNRSNLLSKATKDASKVNAKAMAAIELKLRAGLYKASIDAKMSPKDAITNIDRFLGDSHQVNATVRRATLFAHYFNTMVKAIGHQIAHPVEQRGSIMNTAYLAGLTAAASYGYQQMTGNKDAYVRMPGELGIIKEGVSSVNDIRHGNLPSIVTNRINPVVKEAGQQVFNHDLFTDKQVGNTAKERASHAVNALIAPTGVVTKVTSGKRSLEETAANQLGLNTPHAKGYQAAPNIPAMNTPKALPGTGEAAQTAYFDGLHNAQQAASGNVKLKDKLATYLDHNKDPTTGGTIQNSPAESITDSRNLATDDKFRAIMQKFEKGQPSHDPMWDLPDDKLKQLLQYKAQYTGDAAKTFLKGQANGPNGSNWIQDAMDKSTAYYNNLPKLPGAKPPVANGPAYPTFSPDVQTLLTNYDKGTPDDRATLQKNFSGELSTAFSQIADWTNQMRKAEGAPELKSYPKADAATQAAINEYNALPTHDGSKGGNAARYAWQKANPDKYSLMQNYLTQTGMNSLVKNASLDQFAGADPNQQLLKDIKNIGQYDIASTKNADGTSTYELNPSKAYAQQQVASATNYSSSNSKYAAQQKSNKETKHLGNTERFNIRAPKGRVKQAKVTLKPATNVGHKFKVSMKTPSKVIAAAPKKNAKVTMKV